MKTLIIVPRYNLTNKKNFMYSFPLGIAYISSVLKKNNYEVDCLNLNHYDGTVKELVNKSLDKEKYDFVGIGNNALGYAITDQIIKAVRNHYSKPKIILGGPIITTNPKLMFKNLNPDIGMIGEAEETIIDLFKSLEKGKPLSEVNGIIYKENGEIKISEKREPIKEIDSIPFPDYDGLDFKTSLEKIPTNFFYPYNAFDYPRVYAILCSRGCPFNCTFCYHEGKYRTRSIDNIMKELGLRVKKYKINMITLYDDCFAVDKERLKEFCKRISELRKEIPWDLKWCAQITVRDINPEILDMMKNAGCDSLSYGFESFNQEVLNSMKKPITPEQIDYAFKLTLEKGIAVQGNFIFGDIAETKETAKKTLDYWKKNSDGQIWLDFIQPYPGSEIFKRCLEKGIIRDEIDFMKNFSSSNILNMTDNLTNKEFNKLVREILNSQGRHYKFTTPLKIRETNNDYYEIETKCPFCNKMINYNNCYIENKFSYSFNMVCRNCHKRYFIASPMRKFAYKYQGDIRSLRKIQIKIRNYFKKLKVGLN